MPRSCRGGCAMRRTGHANNVGRSSSCTVISLALAMTALTIGLPPLPGPGRRSASRFSGLLAGAPSCPWPLDQAKRLRWPLLFGQFGGPIKLTPDHHYAANGRDNTIAGACPGDGVVAVCTYTSSGVRPAKTECGRRAL
jgi:hypothetical protein